MVESFFNYLGEKEFPCRYRLLLLFEIVRGFVRRFWKRNVVTYHRTFIPFFSNTIVLLGIGTIIEDSQFFSDCSGTPCIYSMSKGSSSWKLYNWNRAKRTIVGIMVRLRGKSLYERVKLQGWKRVFGSLT